MNDRTAQHARLLSHSRPRARREIVTTETAAASAAVINPVMPQGRDVNEVHLPL